MKKLVLFITIPLLLFNCSKDDNPDDPSKDKDINVFSVKQDLEMGKDFDAYIRSDTSGFDVLDSALYPEAYAHIYRMRDEIISKADINHKDLFPYRVAIIRDDSTLNAFATPGGFSYYYTGLIKYLDNESQLAGVMAHEFAHSARRHSTDQLTKQYGISLLYSIVVGSDPNAIAQIAAGLLTLKFSRAHESEADEYAVYYLNPTTYDGRGVAGFFEKLINDGQGGGNPEFLSTHPNPDNRVQNIHTTWQELGSVEGKEFPERYQEFKLALP